MFFSLALSPKFSTSLPSSTHSPLRDASSSSFNSIFNLSWICIFAKSSIEFEKNIYIDVFLFSFSWLFRSSGGSQNIQGWRQIFCGVKNTMFSWFCWESNSVGFFFLFCRVDLLNFHQLTYIPYPSLPQVLTTGRQASNCHI